MHSLRNAVFAAALVLCVVLAGCSAPKADSSLPPASSRPIVPEKSADASSDNIPSRSEEGTAEAHTPPAPSSDASEQVDLDLTDFSPNMLYAEVYNITSMPEDYIGKSIKITGQFGHFNEFDENGAPIPDKDIFVCVISDAMACCATGLEFVPAEESFSENYPQDGTPITVTGVCDILIDEIGHFPIVQLRDAHIEQVK